MNKGEQMTDLSTRRTQPSTDELSQMACEIPADDLLDQAARLLQIVDGRRGDRQLLDSNWKMLVLARTCVDRAIDLTRAIAMREIMLHSRRLDPAIEREVLAQLMAGETDAASVR